MVSTLDGFEGIGKVRGPQAAQQLTQINKTINRINRNNVASETAPAIQQAFQQITSRYKNSLSKQFESVGLDAEVGQMQSLYKQYGDVITAGRTKLNSEKGAEAFLNELTAAPGKHGTATGQAKLLDQLAPDYFQNIQVKEAAKQFTPWAPKIGLVQSVGSASAGFAAGAGMISGPAVAAGALAMSPQAVAKGVIYMSKMKDFVSTLPQNERLKILADPKATDAVVRTVFDAWMTEDQDVDSLLQQSGVKQ